MYLLLVRDKAILYSVQFLTAKKFNKKKVPYINNLSTRSQFENSECRTPRPRSAGLVQTRPMFTGREKVQELNCKVSDT